MRSPAGRWGPGCSEVEVRIERREPGGSTEAHALSQTPGPVPGAVPTRLTSSLSDPGRWIVTPFHR